jgi:hypothetical protein
LCEEIGGRVAIDAENGNLADYLQDLLENEPIELVDLTDELAQVGGEAKILEPKMKSEDRLDHFITQKIAGTLRADKENVSIAGFELIWAPVYRYWMTIKKRTHNLQIDGCGGYPINYDDIPVRKKTWADRLEDDIELLKDPKKWREFLKNKSKAIRSASVPKQGGGKRNNTSIELIVGIFAIILFFVGFLQQPIDWQLVVISVVVVAILFWVMNHKREKPLVPLPAPPYVDPYAPPRQ